MADFSAIPREIARKIAAEHLDNLEDIEAFGEVCTTWRSETKDVNYMNFRPSKNTQLPWLMLADSPSCPYRRFYSLSKRMYRQIDLPHFDAYPYYYDRLRFFSSRGWLIAVSWKEDPIMFFDPFSGSIIQPPCAPIEEKDEERYNFDEEAYLDQFSKFIFSSNSRPSSSSSPCDDFQVAMIFNIVKLIAFWRPGQRQWIQPDMDYSEDRCQIDDACFFRGEFYSIDHDHQVMAYGSETPMPPPRIVVNLKPLGKKSMTFDKFYIVVLGSTLLVIHRRVRLSKFWNDKNGEYQTMSFQLFELNVDNGEARVVEDIGNRALFVGHGSTFFVEASPSDKLGCRPNSIYFTDDNVEYYCYSNSFCGGGGDMGIYSLEEREVVGRFYEGPSQFDFENPPIWVELPHY